MTVSTPLRTLCVLSSMAAAPLLHAAALPAPVKALEAEGIRVIAPFKAPGGLNGYAGTYGKRPVAIYLTPDGKHAILGTMIGPTGEDVSKPVLDRLVSKPMTATTWKQLEGSAWIADGSPKAARVVYVFTDPNCPYCQKFWKDARPWVDSGKVQLRHIMVGILGPTSPGKAAALLSAKDPAAALHDHETRKGGGVTALAEIPARAGVQLQGNHSLMEQLELGATPAILYKDGNGVLQMVQGAPQPDRMEVVLGKR